jgi:uncharacterized membrane protein YeaQ/YmgE (transglycosylase-associated protein family)
VIGALILGLLAGGIARLLIPGTGGMGCIMTELLGLAGAAAGYLIFTELLGVGDTEMFDLGGLPGAVIGAILVLLLFRAVSGRGDTRTR